MVCVGLFSCPDPLIALEHVGLNLGLGEVSDRLPEHLSFGAGLEFCNGHRITEIGCHSFRECFIITPCPHRGSCDWFQSGVDSALKRVRATLCPPSTDTLDSSVEYVLLHPNHGYSLRDVGALDS